MTQPPRLNHLDEQGRASMVDVSAKPTVRRRAVARATLVAKAGTLDRVLDADLPKGDALAAARLAGILAAKRTDELIPLCHGLPLDHVEVTFRRAGPDRLEVTAAALTAARTGVEMEALTAVSIAALTLYDMAKAIDKAMRIEAVHLVEKTRDPALPGAPGAPREPGADQSG